MRAGRQHQPAWVERYGTPTNQHADLVRRETGPGDRLVLDRHAGLAGARGQIAAQPELPVRRRIFVAVGQRLGVLPASRRPLVEQHHRGPRLGRGNRRRQPGRSAAHHQHVARALRRRRVHRHGRQRCGSLWWLAAHLHRLGNLGQAGALADPPVDRHHAVEAGTHAAMQPARRPAGRAAEGDDPGRRQRRRHRLARQRRDVAPVEADADRRPGRADRPMFQSHVAVASPCCRAPCCPGAPRPTRGAARA